MTSEKMLKTKLPDGHWFENIAKLGQKPNWKIVKKPEPFGAAMYIDSKGQLRRCI